MTTWRIYGSAEGNGSWPRVAQGLFEGLHDTNVRVSFFPIDDVGHDLDTPVLPGEDADVGIFVGPPPNARIMRGHGAHKHRWLMLAPNSSWLPEAILGQIEEMGSITGYVTPSEWGRKIIANYTELPIHVWCHGVSKDLRALEPTPDDGGEDLQLGPPSAPWNLLHMSSTQFERKSTHMLVEAYMRWRIAMGDKASGTLHIVVDGAPSAVEAIVEREARGSFLEGSVKAPHFASRPVMVHPRRDMSIDQLRMFFYAFDAVIQPSRSEGFGMVPLEARACGIPAVMTLGTGHDEHAPPRCHTGDRGLDRGVVLIPVGPEGPIDDGPSAVAPTVTHEHISAALGFSWLHRKALAKNAFDAAPSVQDEWCWHTQTLRFLDAVTPWLERQ